ncbi:hypothetical protein LUZ60_017303 [Juncus effusus]|nr:hypothetical protein LUZ60_017303 [Juncus effusus]
MNLSYNDLSGNIPMFLENLSSLIMLDLSFNHLEGPVPKKGVFSNITGLSIIGNAGLCGGIPQLHLPVCPSQHNKKISPFLIKILIFVLPSATIFMVSLVAIIYVLLKRLQSREKEATKPMLLDESYPKVSYAELVKATDSFSANNLLGFGRYGSVYKGALSFKYKQTPHDYAIKVFNLEVQGTSKSFLAECDAVRMIRHHNLISLVTCCSSTDFKGNDFKALVFDFMPKGNLEIWLHRDEGPFLSFIERLNITVNLVDAIDYLHNNCKPSIIHCDLKPSNILLDDDLIAHVGDFGLAKLLPTSISQQLLNSQSTMGIRGTIGYVAPEYGDGGPVSTQADVYSFGIILLEMFTGKMPTNDMFKDGLTLHTFVEMAFPEMLHDIVDPNMMPSESDSDLEIQNEHGGDSFNKIHKFLVSILQVGLMCSKQLPAQRRSIKDAALELHSIRNAYIRAP